MIKQFNRISVIGLGYIGLPTAAVIASRKIKVTGVDINQHVVDTINEGNIHIVEPDLDAVVKTAVRDGYLRATTSPEPADAFLICVPTPFKENFQPDLSYIEAAAKAIAPVLEPNNLVILESTSPVGTTQKIENLLKNNGVDTDSIFISYCPERVLPGNILEELIMNNRIVGGLSVEASVVTSSFYKNFVKGEVVETSANTAEMCKLTENSFRDLNIAFANELSMICQKENLDVWELISLANLHPRVDILRPGVGVGGHCIAVDPWFIVDSNPNEAKLIKLAREVNLNKTSWVFNQIKDKADEIKRKRNKKAKIACLGLTFKPNIDDLRESPAIEIITKLHANDYETFAVEPNIQNHQTFKLISLEKAISDCDILAILVEHDEFKELKNNKVHKDLCILNFCGS